MNPFLQQVADHYYKKGDISRRCFIFPNRRSMVFFRQWLCREVASSEGCPLLAPKMMTINDFFQSLSGLHIADRIDLLIELYACYRDLNGKAEPLDEFIFWGDVILGDFNDVDKYLADPRQLFANVSDFKAIQDTYSYLTDAQRAAIESFVSHFNDRSGKLTVNLDSDDPGVKERFLQIWNLMYPLYVDFNEALKAKSVAYEGMAYRSLAESLSDRSVEDVLKGCFADDVSFVFVGLNALNECEKSIMRRLRDSGKAEFCWDWSGEMIRDGKNRASFFMSENYSEFRQAFEVDPEGVVLPSFNALSVPSSYGQVKHLSSILEKVGYEASAIGGCSDTAVVLPDEGLLMPLLNSVPEYVEDINVTMGYPMTASEFYVLMSDVVRMQLHLREKDNGWHFYHKQVWDILSSGLLRTLMASDEMAGCRNLVAEVKLAGKYYIPQEDLSGNPLLDMIFRPVARDLSSSDPSQTGQIATYLQDIVTFLAPMMKDDPDMAVEIEAARRYYSCINSLKAKNLAVQPATFMRLLESLMEGVTIPFQGEPLKGLQVMGPLETRALDFRNVIILSCNEGMFPRRSVSSSFIPPELRKAFTLPTYEYQDAIWAYYFYRLVCRAENVWMVYDSRTEGLKRGEESRYIKQLKYHFGIDVKSYVAGSGLIAASDADGSVEKTDGMMEIIDNMTFSVSALQNYVMCPMKFCYSSVLKLKKDEDIAESLDSAMIGTVYHNTMWALYYGGDEMASDGPFEKLDDHSEVGMASVTKDYLASWLKREDDIYAKVTALMKAELKSDSISGRDLVVRRVIVLYVLETIRKDIALLDKHCTESFRIVGLEKKLSAQIHGAKFFGVVDRVDSLHPDMIRMTDYKSGSDSPDVLNVLPSKENAAVNKIFDAKYSTRKHHKAALQFYIYDRMLQESGLADGKTVCNTMYSTKHLFENVPEVYQVNPVFAGLMDERVKAILDEIRCRDIPFRMADDVDTCEYCDFRMICGR